MLEELYQYALSHELAARPGFKLKRPKAYFHLSASGQFLDLELRERDAPAVMAPDVGAAANGTKFCNPLIEKAGICLCVVEDEKKDKNVPAKHEFFLSFLEEGKETEPLFGVAAEALRDGETREKMRETLRKYKLKPMDPVGFVVDGGRLEKSERYLDWWEEFRKRFQTASEGIEARCLITGELSQPMTTVPKVSGLSRVGGHTSGDAFLCFDKDAFQSYGLKQSANAAVSEEAMTAVNAALGKLIQEAEILGGTKMVHWYTGQVSEQEDLIGFSLGTIFLTENEEEDPEEEEGREQDAFRAARKLVRSIQEGKVSGKLAPRYYMLPLSGAGGRMMVRGWYEGSYEALYENVSLWFEDLRLILPDGRGKTYPPKMKALCIRMLKPGGSSKSVLERLDHELKNLSQRMMYAAVQGGPLPDETAHRALQWLRSEFLTNGKREQNKENEPNGGSTAQAGGTRRGRKQETLVYQLLKAWLRRKQRREGESDLMTEELNKQNRGTAYLCGRLMAVYSAIQEIAMPDNNVGVAERYFAAAMASPGLVIGKLAQLSQYHLNKLGRGSVIFYERILTEIYQAIGGQNIPTALTMMQQTEFALGYYQQRAEISPKKKQEERND